MSAVQEAVDLAARALRHGDRTGQELDERLQRAGFDEETRQQALERLRALRYLDDARVAATRAETLATRGHGDASIRHDLARRGVESDAIEAVVAALEPEADRVRRIVAREGAGARVARRLAARGFSREAIAEAFSDAVAAEDGESV